MFTVITILEHNKDVKRSNSPYHISSLNKDFTPTAWSNYEPQNIPLFYTGLYSTPNDFLNSLNQTLTKMDSFVKNINEYFFVFKKSKIASIKNDFFSIIKSISATTDLIENGKKVLSSSIKNIKSIDVILNNMFACKLQANPELLPTLTKQLESLNDLIKKHSSVAVFEPLTDYKLEEFIRYAHWRGKFEQLDAIKLKHIRTIVRSRIRKDIDGGIIIPLGMLAEKLDYDIGDTIAEESYYDIGINYLYGIDQEPIDKNKAFFYFEKASQLSDSPKKVKALAALGKCYMRGFGVKKDISKAKILFKEAIPMLKKMDRDGDPEAKFHLADICFDGQMMERNHQKIVQWLLPAALSSGFVPAQILLAKEYMWATPAETYLYPDNTEHLLVRLLRLAAAGDAVEPILLLGRLMLLSPWLKFDQIIYNGTYGIDGSVNQTLKFLQFAAMHGSTEAMLYLAGINIQGTMVKPNKEDGLMYLSAAYEKGSARAAYFLGGLYLQGKIWEKELVSIDKTKGEKLLRESAEQGCPEAQTELATLIIVDKIKPQHEFEAISLLGHSIRHTSEHEFYNKMQNYLEAKKWLEEAFKKNLNKLVELIQSNNKNVTTINLEGWPLDDYSTQDQLTPDKFADLSDILKVIESNTTITELDLRHINLSIKSYNQIALFLFTNKTVKNILLDEPKDEESKRIMDDVITPCLQSRQGKDIQCKEMDLRGYQTQLITKLFSPIVFHCYNHLSNLNLSHIKADDELLKDMLPHLVQIQSLKILNLSNNWLSSDSFKRLGENLISNDHIRAIDLSQNKITNTAEKLVTNAKKFSYTSDESKEERLEINLTGNYLSQDCDVLIRKKNLGEEVIANNRVSFYSYNPAKSPVHSMLAPNHILKVGGTNACVVALGAYKNKEHAIIFYEGLRTSGQRFFHCFDVVPDKRNSCQVSIRQKVFLGRGQIRINAKSVATINDAKCYIRAFIVDADKGEKLFENVSKQKSKNNGFVNFWLFKNSPEGDYVNCLQWAKQRLNEIGITNIPDTIYPTKAAQPHEQMLKLK